MSKRFAFRETVGLESLKGERPCLETWRCSVRASTRQAKRNIHGPISTQQLATPLLRGSRSAILQITVMACFGQIGLIGVYCDVHIINNKLVDKNSRTTTTDFNRVEYAV
ncbi:hypothetical protein NQ318_014164 [Aromia moschata]|uniref:Uncharacterized protein n=1 Tax=Aromia moschata TaxID=1265417 RepID=A0AAV8Y8E9_9CUCU|nr:hypothetical protein NQ318_014164 [Aromia moschata]